MAKPTPPSPEFTLETVLTPSLLTELSLTNYESMDLGLRTWFESQVDRCLSEIGRAGVDSNSVYVSNLGKPDWPALGHAIFRKNEDGSYLLPFACLEVMALTDLLDSDLSRSLALRKAVADRLVVLQTSQEQKGVVTRAFLELVVLLAGKLVELGGTGAKSDRP